MGDNIPIPGSGGAAAWFLCDHVGRLLGEAGWSRLKTVERASQPNEEAIKEWEYGALSCPGGICQRKPSCRALS